jgi:PhnB protein
MAKATTPIPAGFQTVTPHLVLKNAAKAIEFYKKAFNAEEIKRIARPDGGILHACIKIGNSHIFLCDEVPQVQFGGLSPESLKNAHATIHLYVEDVDKVFKQAIDAGATAQMPVQDQFWGDRYGRLIDPFGQPWSIATHKEDLTTEEQEKRAAEACKQMAAMAK